MTNKMYNKMHRQRRTSHSETERRGGVAINDVMRATRRRGGKRCDDEGDAEAWRQTI